MKKTTFILSFFLLPFLMIAQDSLNELLDQYNNESIPYISVTELSVIQDKVILLDAREIQEYQVSHLKGAIYVGYEHFDINIPSIKNLNKEAKIVVYCSLGVRSEDISEKLKKAGYKDVHNLYGGIFEWKNKNYQVINTKGESTDNVHAFSPQWSKWLLNGTKVYTQ
ncbi:rhodanese-like domain-containing protein [Aquimarina sp. 2201CG14-23]|uniref:rhodanese-like domain-containing protein n=1 Tax=Aquimarina mycalae TaxID=3040073 RepID=UPI0024780C61|nr:rhodanese-like domain-containing protein [Aquimarina sp. 2201CG14-23]MDH7447944.1 rhodanese-like domain-containing protein [Aquimarina sp. 2201CG14-23]